MSPLDVQGPYKGMLDNELIEPALLQALQDAHVTNRTAELKACKIVHGGCGEINYGPILSKDLSGLLQLFREFPIGLQRVKFGEERPLPETWHANVKLCQEVTLENRNLRPMDVGDIVEAISRETHSDIAWQDVSFSVNAKNPQKGVLHAEIRSCDTTANLIGDYCTAIQELLSRALAGCAIPVLTRNMQATIRRTPQDEPICTTPVEHSAT